MWIINIYIHKINVKENKYINNRYFMRVIENVKKFILENKKKQKFVFLSREIPANIKTFLLNENMLYSPIRGIYILKKSEMLINEAIWEHLFSIIKLLGWVIWSQSALKIHTWEYKNMKSFFIITKNKNFETYIGEGKNIFVKFVASSVSRISQKIPILWEKLEVESLLSVVINNFSLVEKNPKIQKLLLQQEISSTKIETFIQKKFKISGLSKLAIFYQQNWYNDKFIVIRNVIKSSWKRLDSRNTHKIKKRKKKKLI